MEIIASHSCAALEFITGNAENKCISWHELRDHSCGWGYYSTVQFLQCSTGVCMSHSVHHSKMADATTTTFKCQKQGASLQVIETWDTRLSCFSCVTRKAGWSHWMRLGYQHNQTLPNFVGWGSMWIMHLCSNGEYCVSPHDILETLCVVPQDTHGWADKDAMVIHNNCFLGDYDCLELHLQ